MAQPLGWIALGGLALAGAWALLSRRKARAAPACAVTEPRVDAWIAATKYRDYYVWYDYGAAPFGTWSAFLDQAATTWPESSAAGLINRDNAFVVTAQNSGFWRYDAAGFPVADGPRKEEYCIFLRVTGRA